MPSRHPRFSDEYSTGPQTIATQDTERHAELTIGRAVSQTTSAQQPDAPTVTVQPELYGTGKPRRVVIRGKISRD